MRKWIRKLFETLGLKRKVAGFLAALGPVIAQNPELAFLIPYVDWLAGSFGLAGLGHAAVNGKSLKEVPAATLASVFSVLLLLTHVVPSLAPYSELVRLLAGLFGVTLVLSGKTQKEAEGDLSDELRKANTVQWVSK